MSDISGGSGGTGSATPPIGGGATPARMSGTVGSMGMGQGGMAGVARRAAPFALGAEGYEYAQHTNPEPHGPTYQMVMSEKDSSVRDPQDPHFLGQLMNPARPHSDEIREFFDATSILGQ
jgi:hypothetical protein